MTAIWVIVLSIIIFTALVINMAFKPAYSAKLTAYLMVIAVLGGSIIYGKGYTDVTGNAFLSLVRTPFSVIGTRVCPRSAGRFGCRRGLGYSASGSSI